MSDIVERLRETYESVVTGNDVLRNPDGPEAAARIEQLEAALLGEETEHSRRIMEVDRLLAALREIAKHSRGGVIDTTEKMDRDEFIGIARAALEGKAIIDANNEIERLRAALSQAANDLENWGAYVKATVARAALEGK